MRQQPPSRGFRSTLRFLACVLAAVPWLGACATSRGEIDMRIEAVANPATGPAVAIRTVVDERTFEAKPSQPSTPSLKYAKDLEDPAIKARAIARKRNTYGKALGDILLPEGRTAADLVRESVAVALQRAGWRVVQPDDPDYATAAGVDVRVIELWAWSTPGFWAVALDFRGRIALRGPVGGLAEGREVKGGVQLHTQGADTRAWRNTIRKGLDDLITKMAEVCGPPPSP